MDEWSYAKDNIGKLVNLKMEQGQVAGDSQIIWHVG